MTHHHLHRGPAADAHAARCRARSSTMPRPAPIRRRRCAPTAPTSSASSCASACWSTCRQRDLATTILGEKVSLPLALAPIGLCGMQHGDGEILACRAAQAAGIPFTLSTMSICSIEDVAAGGRQAVLVPALRDEGPRLRPRADRARRRGQVQRAGAHRRPAGARPAPLRHQERHDGAAGDQARATSSTSRPSRPGRSAILAASARPSAISPAT